ncbi:MAG TPA: hypothetical protein VMT18_14380 [Planctomycetota bacterium]|nr:hypothetical protein [Planctomycetota bacterium]
MIRPLRARHRAIFALLAVLVPAGYATALLGRRAPAPESIWPAPPTSERVADGPERSVMWSPISLLTRLRRSNDGTLGVRLESWEEPAPPATILYWSPREPVDGELPAAARFVGALGAAPRELVLRDAPDGWLVLYSLGHGEVLGALDLAEGP